MTRRCYSIVDRRPCGVSWQRGCRRPGLATSFLPTLHYDHCMDYGYLVLSRWDQGAGQIPDLHVYGPGGTARMTALLFGEDGVFQADLAGRTPASRQSHDL